MTLLHQQCVSSGQVHASIRLKANTMMKAEEASYYGESFEETVVAEWLIPDHPHTIIATPRRKSISSSSDPRYQNPHADPLLEETIKYAATTMKPGAGSLAGIINKLPLNDYEIDYFSY